MTVFFYVAATIAVIATVLVIFGRNPVHALLNLVVSLLAVSALFFMLGAPFAGALEIIVYAGAIMVLFVFVVMMLTLGTATNEQERRWLTPKTWLAPSVLSGRSEEHTSELQPLMPISYAGFRLKKKTSTT